MYKNYIFDLYGTLIDIHTDESSKNFFKKYAKWLRKQGFAFEWKCFYKLYHQTESIYRNRAAEKGQYANPEINIEDVFRDIFATKNYQLSNDEILYLCENFRCFSWIYICLFPDTIECLEKLKKAGKNIYLLSNAQRSFTWQELEQTDLIKYFDGILISSDEGCMKPDPQFYNICCKRYNLDKTQSIMIGNELKSDIAGANASGIDSFYINRMPIFHEPKEPLYKFVSKNGSLMEVLTQTIK